MTKMLKSLVVAIPFIFASFAGPAMAAGEELEQKTIDCKDGSRKLIDVDGGQRAIVFEIILSSSTATQVQLELGSDTILETFMRSNDTVQVNLGGYRGDAGRNLRVKCAGNGQLAVTVLYTIGGLS